ncbi:hypothetical protein BFP72_16855 [Reichenbachiella sp. 5M10]|uniref:TetR/AcrR family transcriptional regulator n=1 Tax=Reichenbachiella sp. 5M10 TaxID=1889772 RepID=UPI000C14D2D6|nr:TetR/AcrR family transcriptional regulator [Reichenbachiella sp. 5M10]PIB36953.1 hypothetical protein BFP72_16855 [Reichenbachiella sp. 5M10]
MPKSVLFDRNQVLDVATKLFWKKGYHATSMQDLVDATGLNRSSLYNSFGDKHQLFEESLRHYQQWQSQTAALSFEKDLSPIQSIHHFFYSMVANIKQDAEQRGCFLSNCTTELANTDRSIQKMLKANKDGLLEVFAQKIRAAQQMDQIDPSKDVGLLALYLYASLQGLQVTAVLLSDSNDLDGLVELILEKL